MFIVLQYTVQVPQDVLLIQTECLNSNTLLTTVLPPFHSIVLPVFASFSALVLIVQL